MLSCLHFYCISRAAKIKTMVLFMMFEQVLERTHAGDAKSWLTSQKGKAPVSKVAMSVSFFIQLVNIFFSF